VRDIIVKDDDLVAATHGRGFWLLDDVTPLRQIDAATASADAVLFKPQTAYRVRWNTNTDTPLPPEEPGAPNPPEGAIINYYLKSPASGPVILEVVDAGGAIVRRYSSADPVVRPDPLGGTLPLYWFRPTMVLSPDSGMHRFTWDLHYQPLAGGGGGRGGLPIAAVAHNTAPAPTAPWVSPGTYTVKLTAGGKTYAQPITVKQDPRVKTPPLVMQRVYGLTRSAYAGAVEAQQAVQEAQALRERIARAKSQPTPPTAALDDLDKKVEALAGSAGGGRGGRGGGFGAFPSPPPDTLNGASAALATAMNLLQGADVQPTALQVTTIETALRNGRAAIARWNALKTSALAATLK
jgi:hypothetical protein